MKKNWSVASHVTHSVSCVDSTPKPTERPAEEDPSVDLTVAIKEPGNESCRHVFILLSCLSMTSLY